MNIVYISNLTGKKSAGLSYSIPLQISSQKRHDNVFWYNINNTPKEKIINGRECFNLADYPNLKLQNLPMPFNNPDLVVFEGVYIYKYLVIAKECWKRDIPYIIIPRSSLTKNAQNKKKYKKKLGNFLYFKKFIKKAAAIQYLTEKEFKDSGLKWNNNFIIIPNGITPKTKVKQFKSSDKLKGVYIGRADSYQKGIDLFLDACVSIKELIKKHNCQIDIFAPKSTEDKDDIQKMINIRSLEDIVKKHDGVYGIKKEKVLLNSDFFILTSRFEGHPMGLIEALSYGLPCLITDGTNMAKEVEIANAGWVSETSVDGIAKAFKKLLSEADQMELKGKNALKLSKQYDWDRLAKISSEKYRNLINKK